ncbi:hypothetical protein [Arthrobacter sp. HLT1-20]
MIEANAAELAGRYAKDSHVEIRELHTSLEMVTASNLLDEVWGLAINSTHVNPGMLIALAHAGNYVVGAFDGEQMVAACIGFFHAPKHLALHSHIAGVMGDRSGSGIGKAVKYHQRAWCLHRGIETVTWTFDPLVARNAFFNLERLGARSVQYLPNFYGEMTDEVNRGHASDRLLLHWDLRGTSAARPSLEGMSPPAVLSRGENGPVLEPTIDRRVRACRIEIPTDVEILRLNNPQAAERWRLAVRAAFIPLLADGWRIAGFDRSGFYHMERN